MLWCKMVSNKISQLAVIVILMITASNVIAQTFEKRPEVQHFIKKMVHKHGFEAAKLNELFQQFSSSKEIITRISTPAEAKPWNYYKQIFITEKRINAGVQFWRKHARAIAKAENMFGVPAEIIVAILGVETFYGTQTGKYPVLQALATLAFDYPKRAPFFLQELEQYLLLTREHKLPAAKLKGSYAGAMGAPQFIASSYRNFAANFNNSGRVDLINNIDDAISSIANYFKVHGWQAKQAIAYRATKIPLKNMALPIADRQNPKPTLSLATLNTYGIKATAKKLNLNTIVALIELDLGANKKEYWLGEQNFYVITRYNHSVNYAMAVYELSEKLKNRYARKAGH